MEPLPVPWELNLGQLESLPPGSSLPFKDKPKDFPDRLWSRRNKHPIDEPISATERLCLQLRLLGRQSLGRRLVWQAGAGEIHPEHGRIGPTALFTARLDRNPSPEWSCSLVKVAGGWDTVLWSNQAKREIALPEKPESPPASAAGLQRSGPGSKEGVQRKAASYSILLWAGTFWQDFRNSFIHQLTLSCMPFPKGHIHHPIR